MTLRHYLYVLFSITCLIGATSTRAAEKVMEQGALAKQYADCAAYYLMISKADPKLRKLARVGEVAADNARLLGNSPETLNMMALETRRMLAQIDNDWGNMGVVIADKADSCKAIMVAE